MRLCRHGGGARLAVLATVPLVLGQVGTARAVDKAACVSYAEEGQQLRNKHMLTAARERLLLCAVPECPSVISQDCTRWLGEVERSLATVTVKAQTTRGLPVVDVKVLFDGKQITDRATTTPITVEPGSHLVRYEHEGSPPVEEHVELAEGERGRVLFVQFAEPAATGTTGTPAPTGTGTASGPLVPTPAPPAEQGGGIPASVWILGGVGVLALGSFTGFALWGKANENNLSCARTQMCSNSDLAPARTKFIIADVSLGVGIVALGAAAVIALTSSSGSAKSSGAVRSDATRKRAQ